MSVPADRIRPESSWRDDTGRPMTPILSAARDAFAEVGYHGTSVRDIARRAGLTVPALYYHHANKEAILAALLDHSINELVERCGQAVDDGGSDPLDRFRNLIECLVLYMTQHGKSGSMDAEIRSLAPASRRAYSTRRRVIEQLMIDTIGDGVRAGTFRVTSPPDTARALLGMVQAITIWFRPGGRASAQTVADRYVDIALHTVGAA